MTSDLFSVTTAGVGKTGTTGGLFRAEVSVPVAEVASSWRQEQSVGKGDSANHSDGKC